MIACVRLTYTTRAPSFSVGQQQMEKRRRKEKSYLWWNKNRTDSHSGSSLRLLRSTVILRAAMVALASSIIHSWRHSESEERHLSTFRVLTRLVSRSARPSERISPQLSISDQRHFQLWLPQTRAGLKPPTGTVQRAVTFAHELWTGPFKQARPLPMTVFESLCRKTYSRQATFYLPFQGNTIKLA